MKRIIYSMFILFVIMGSSYTAYQYGGKDSREEYKIDI
jgi:hypothetical protein